MVSWLLIGAPEQRYWQNRETANVGLDSSVGRAPARQSGGHRFKSRSSKFFFVHPNLSKICTQSVSLVVYYMINIKEINLTETVSSRSEQTFNKACNQCSSWTQWPYHVGYYFQSLMSSSKTSTLIPCPVDRDNIVPLSRYNKPKI